MRRKSIVLLLLVSTVILVSTISIEPVKAEKVYVEEGDLISFGYRLVVNTFTFEVKDEDNPKKVWFTEPNFKPPGLYDDLLGMELGSIKNNVIVYPEEGYTVDDGSYAGLANQTLYYYDIKIYEVGGYYYTDYESNGGETPSFGKIFLNILYSILGIGGVVLIGFGIYKLYPRILEKRCVTCKSLAVGACKKCGKHFCETCYSNGCPYCKSRTLLRFKSKT